MKIFWNILKKCSSFLTSYWFLLQNIPKIRPWLPPINPNGKCVMFQSTSNLLTHHQIHFHTRESENYYSLRPRKLLINSRTSRVSWHTRVIEISKIVIYCLRKLYIQGIPPLSISASIVHSHSVNGHITRKMFEHELFK